jgi:hypothetical protein
MPAPSKPRHIRGCFISAVAYVATTWICVWLLANPLAGSSLAWRALVSIVPLVPMGFSVREVLRLVRAGDELQRRMDLEALAIAAIAVGVGCLTLNLLIRADVVVVTARQATLWVFPALVIAYAIARAWTHRRYQ